MYTYSQTRKFFTYVILTLLLFAKLGDKALAYAAEPKDQIQSTVEQIIQLITSDNLEDGSIDDRKREEILAIVDQRFNFQLMSRLALGKAWAGRSDEEQGAFVRLFSELLKKTYVRRVESYAGEKVVFSREDIKRDLAQVHGLFFKNDKEIPIVYKLKRQDDQWKVFDVVIEGASIIKQYRRQFAQILKEEKFQDLIIRLEEKVKLLSNS